MTRKNLLNNEERKTEMKKADEFINCYSLSKTLRFSLIPMGRTYENFKANRMLETDKERAESYEKVKGYIDRFHKYHIETFLADAHIESVREYADLYYKIGKTDKEFNLMEKMEDQMRKAVVKALTKNEQYKSIFGKDIIENLLPTFLTDEEEKKNVEMFYGFTTYFIGFAENRKNMYTDKEQSTGIAYRCINDNLPKFLDNSKNFNKVKEVLTREVLNTLDESCMQVYGIYAGDIFSLDYFDFVLTQSGIDKYNGVIGGYTDNEGNKIKGLNEYINLYNQQVAKSDKTKRIPFMKPLYKQILSDGETVSFIPEKFKSDNEVVSSVNELYKISTSVFAEIQKLFENFDEYNSQGIYVASGKAVTDISNAVFGSWNAVSDAWNAEYEEAKPLKKGKDVEKYFEDERTAYKKIKSFSTAELQRLGSKVQSENCLGNVAEYYKKTVAEIIKDIDAAYENAEELLNSDYEENNSKKLAKNNQAIQLLKTLLDNIKSLERLLKPLRGSGKEEQRDDLFYSEFLALYNSLTEFDRVYDKVRNYVTQKPYKTDKIKLNFNNPKLLGGWDKNKETDYRCVLLKKDGLYYLAIMNKGDNKLFVDPPCDDLKKSFEKIEYKLLPGPNKMLPKVFFANSNIGYYAPSEKILEIRRKETFKKGDNFSISDCHEFIDFFKSSIEKHEDWRNFGFKFSPTESYNDISEFYKEVQNQGYSIKYRNVSEKYINDLVESGRLYLFKLYNKDFSPYSHGKPNLHTMYFKMLFDERNLEDVVYKLNGEAEMFYREASINKNEAIIHPANQPIDNKNPDNPKKTSTFEYTLTKDKRYTEDKFLLHIPISLNFKAKGKEFINNDVRLAVKNSKENYVIGIDRGERNLLYICVINSKGELVEQKSLNEIISDNGYKVDYHNLLDRKEKEREAARQNWGTVENIKELKEGYLSQVIHEICKLVLKYDAVIAMEDLNSGFKNSRFKVEKQVYQKFENMLITKLNYLTDKNIEPEEKGGLLNAYQLTNKVDGVNRGRQNGIIFYVPAWLTSKIDPVTGFVDLVKPKYRSISDTIEFIKRIDGIAYNKSEDYFEFDLDYSKFPRAGISYRKKWIICTNGERIINKRDKNKNNQWVSVTINLTEEFKNLFERFDVDYCNKDIKSQITLLTNKDFCESFMRLMSATLQMRNSETGNVDVDYLISPIRQSNGKFYDSRDYLSENEQCKLPENADANGAYNIARKALWAIDVLKNTEDEELKNANLSIKNVDWLEFVQK